MIFVFVLRAVSGANVAEVVVVLGTFVAEVIVVLGTFGAVVIVRLGFLKFVVRDLELVVRHKEEEEVERSNSKSRELP